MSDLSMSARMYELVVIPDSLQAMGKRLKELGLKTHALDTTFILLDLERAVEKAAELADIWYAVERLDSGDGDMEGVEAAIEALKTKHLAAWEKYVRNGAVTTRNPFDQVEEDIDEARREEDMGS